MDCSVITMRAATEPRRHHPATINTTPSTKCIIIQLNAVLPTLGKKSTVYTLEILASLPEKSQPNDFNLHRTTIVNLSNPSSWVESDVRLNYAVQRVSEASSGGSGLILKAKFNS